METLNSNRNGNVAFAVNIFYVVLYCNTRSRRGGVKSFFLVSQSRVTVHDGRRLSSRNFSELFIRHPQSREESNNYYGSNTFMLRSPYFLHFLVLKPLPSE